jgi:branched-chain amino acid transport system permease protein
VRDGVPGWARAGLAAAVILTVPLWLRDPYYLHLAITIAMFAIAALGARLLLLLGLWSFGQGVFLTIGAYTSAILVVDLGLSFWASLPIAAFGGSVAAAAVGYPALRLRGVYFAIFTMVLVFAAREGIILSPGLTGGASGFLGIPPPDPITIGGVEVSFGPQERYAIVAALLVLTMGVMYRIDRSRLGKVLAAIRQGEVLAESVGINLTRYRVGAFVIAAFFTTATGAFSAHYYGVAHPETWGLWPSIFIIAYAIIGGVGSVFGPVAGAAVGVLIVELLRATEGLQGVLLGVALIIVGLVMPGGLTDAISKETVDRIVGRLAERRCLGWVPRLRQPARPPSTTAVQDGAGEKEVPERRRDG